MSGGARRWPPRTPWLEEDPGPWAPAPTPPVPRLRETFSERLSARCTREDKEGVRFLAKKLGQERQARGFDTRADEGAVLRRLIRQELKRVGWKPPTDQQDEGDDAEPEEGAPEE